MWDTIAGVMGKWQGPQVVSVPVARALIELSWAGTHGAVASGIVKIVSSFVTVNDAVSDEPAYAPAPETVASSVFAPGGPGRMGR